jgi:hypothetical protein
VWGSKWLASRRKFDTDVKHKARKRASELVEENRWRDAQPEFLKGGFETFDALLFRPCDTQDWRPLMEHENVTTDIYWYRNIPDMPREGREKQRARLQWDSHNTNLSRCLLD